MWKHERNRSFNITRHELNITNCISDGKLSLDVFGVFLCQIIDQIYAFPGITETRILKQFDYVCPRTSLLDFLARLELTGIIIKQRVKYQEPRLVSKIFPFLFVVKFREFIFLREKLLKPAEVQFHFLQMIAEMLTWYVINVQMLPSNQWRHYFIKFKKNLVSANHL